MTFKQVKPLKGSELVMQQIQAQIRSGEYAPGAKLASVVDLAISFGVGRSTIREALSALKAMGWIHIQQGGGTYVAAKIPEEQSADLKDWLDRADSLKQIVEVRRVLETGCAALAALKRTEEDLAAMQLILEQMEQSLDNEDIGEALDVQFHLQIAAATHNPLLLEMMESLSQRLHETMKESRRLWFYGERSSANRLLQEHKDIFEAIKAAEGDIATGRMIEHIRKVDSVLQQQSPKSRF